jgi:hypothetical protein
VISVAVFRDFCFRFQYCGVLLVKELCTGKVEQRIIFLTFSASASLPDWICLSRLHAFTGADVHLT